MTTHPTGKPAASPAEDNGTPVKEPPAGLAPALLDPAVAHPARVYSFWLGGGDCHPADREVAQQVARLRPEVLAGARANREFGRRVTSYAAGASIRQFLDIGAGLPTAAPTHETAQRVSPACRTVYVDNDPMVNAYRLAQLAAAPGTAPAESIDADLRDPAGLLDSASGVLDFSEPVAVLLLAVLHFIPDRDQPAAIVSQLASALAPGSLIAVSHVTADYAPRTIADAADAYNARVPLPVYPRSRSDIAALLGPLPIQYPGVVPVSYWQPSLREPAPQLVDICAAVTRLPLAARARAGVAPPSTRVRNPAVQPARSLDTEADAEAAELARRAAEFPHHRLTRETTMAGGVRYIADGLDLDAHPSVVITRSLRQLFAVLTA
jgi:O-methyltransferase involved in polyketide biosynthesis